MKGMRLVLGAVCCVLCADLSRAADDTLGVLVLAHGGSPRWNRLVEATVAEARLGYPTEIAFGMGRHDHEVRGFQRAVERLERTPVGRIIVVPLLVCSASDVMRQYQYLFGLRARGPWEEVTPLTLGVPVVMSHPLDDDPVVAEILLERARAVSQIPPQEAVVLVAHGPVTDEDNERWLEIMRRIAERVERLGNFRAVLPVTMRDDAPKPVVDLATARLREVVKEQGRLGPVLVVPLLVANGGIEEKIPKRLSGLRYTFQERTLSPHPKLSRWIAGRVLQAAGPGTVRAGGTQEQHGVGHVNLR